MRLRSSSTVALVAGATLMGSCHAAFAASDAFHQAVLADEPVLYFQLAETGNGATSVAANKGSLGIDFDADYLGSPIRGAGTESGDKGVRFDSEDDYLQTHSVAPDGLGGNPTFSAEALFYVLPDGTASLWAPFLHWGGADVDGTMKSAWFSFQNGNPERLYAGFYNGGLRTVNDVPRGQWHHVVWVRQGGGAANVGTTLYVDGVSVALENDPDLPADTATPNVFNTEFRINRARDFARFFTGSIDELALYDKALTQEQVAVHFAALVPCAATGAEKCVDYDGGCKVCGQPSSTGGTTTAGDALSVLKTAVGSRKCNLCICDVDHSGSVVASDALLTLKFAVGQPVVLACLPPAP
ncbi:MAG TPA: LamG domain-containing protein [Candidatus Binatia bacterium]|jgi:hypothetical protein